MLWRLPFNWKTKLSLASIQRRKLVGLSQWFSVGVILLPNQLALSGDFLGVRVWGQGWHHWCLVSKGWERLLLHTQHWFFKNLTMHRTTPHTKNDPAQFVNNAKDKKQQWVSSPPVTFPSSPNPPHSATQAFPSPAPASHPTLFSCLCPLLTSHHQQQAQSNKVWERGQERGHIWREGPL